MREKLEHVDLGLPVEDLAKLKQMAADMTAASGVKTTQSDIIRNAIDQVAAAPEKFGEMMTRLLQGAFHGDQA